MSFPLSEPRRDREQQLDNIIHEYYRAAEQGDPPAVTEFIAAHPEFASELREFYSGVGNLQGLVAKAAGEPALPETCSAAPATLRLDAPGSDVHYFGNYELLEEIGRGGMGVVYRARELRLNRIVALKMVLAGDFASSEELQRFTVEAESAAQLEHPRIVPVHEIGSVGNQHFYTMGYVKGRNLQQFKCRGIEGVSRAARIIQQTAEAVAYAHAHGIVHRDLKPANILLDQDGCPRITDFGLAKRSDVAGQLTRTGQILGTPGYMAPEQAAGESHKVGPAVDIYALGAMLYFTLTGRPPFKAANVIDTLVQVLESEPTTPRLHNREIPSSLEQICMRCLERAPEDRYPSAMAVAEDLDRFLQGQPVLARPPTSIERMRRFARRAPALAVHLFALGLLQIVSQIYYFTGAERELDLHLRVTALLLFWIMISVATHVAAKRKPAERIAGPALLCIDAVLITVLIAMMTQPGAPPGPLVAGYPLLIVGGAMFFKLSRVVVVTVASIASYLGLLIAEPHLIDPVHYQICFIIMLLAIAGCVGHQVRRVKSLSDYFESLR